MSAWRSLGEVSWAHSMWTKGPLHVWVCRVYSDTPLPRLHPPESEHIPLPDNIKSWSNNLQLWTQHFPTFPVNQPHCRQKWAFQVCSPRTKKFCFPKYILLCTKGYLKYMNGKKWFRKIRANPSQILTTPFLRLRGKEKSSIAFFHCKSKIPFFNQVDMGNSTLRKTRNTVSELWPTCPNGRTNYDQTFLLREIWTMRCLPKPILIMICITQPLQKQCHLRTGKNLERKHQYRGIHSWN